MFTLLNLYAPYSYPCLYLLSILLLSDVDTHALTLTASSQTYDWRPIERRRHRVHQLIQDQRTAFPSTQYVFCTIQM